MADSVDDRPRLEVIVVDDEAPARELLREFLAAYSDLEVVAECANGFEAVKAVHELSPDLMLLDVQMPKLNGLEVLELLDSPPAVIFTTAFEEHALRAFELHAVDYLLKPFSPERLAEALARARDRLERGEKQPLAELAAARRPAGEPLRRVLVREGARIHVIPCREIDYVEAQDDYVVFHAQGRVLRKKQTLTELTGLLPPESFVRIHRCYLLHLERLERLEPYSRGSHVALLDDGTRLPVSRSGYRRLRDLL